MICPLCGQRRARRACPALGQQICAVCCGTKRLVEIRCPADCPYLASAREHPAASVVRRQQRDLALVLQFVRDLNEQQSQLFFLVSRFLVQYEPPELYPLVDDDVMNAAAALAATFETESRGVIYDHRPSSLPAERLVTGLKPILAEAGQRGGTRFQRDAAVVLRRIEEAARETHASAPQDRRAFIELLIRVVRNADRDDKAAAPEAPRLIVP